MSKKVNTTIKIKCNDEVTANLLFSLLEGHAPQHKNDMNGLVARQGMGVVDTTFSDFNREKLTFGVTTKPTDKGDVFVLTDGEVNIAPYTSLEDREVYGLVDQGVKLFSYDKDGYDRHWTTVASMASLKEALTLLPSDPQVAQFFETLDRQRTATVEDAEIVEEVAEEAVMAVSEKD